MFIQFLFSTKNCVNKTVEMEDFLVQNCVIDSRGFHCGFIEIIIEKLVLCRWNHGVSILVVKI